MEVHSVNNVISKENAPSFGAKKLDPEVINYINKSGGKLSRFLNYVGENQGEALNILVTAAGTAIVCPLFIAYNPFSKEDKDTKAYSAWRQPISAVIAVVSQLTITKWFNNALAKLASTKDKSGNAHFERADLRAQPHERYLTRIIKLEHPDWDNKQIQAEVKKRQLDAEKAEIRRFRELMKDKPIEIKELVSQDYYDKAENQLLEELKAENRTEIETKFGKKIDDIWSTKLNKYLDKLLEEKAKSLGKSKQALIQETAETMIEKEVTAEAVTKTIIRYLKSKGANVNTAINTCSTEGIETIIKDLHLENHFADGLDAQKIAQEIVNKLHHIREYEQTQQLQDFTSVKEMGSSFEEVLHNVKVKKLVRSKTSNAKKVFKTMNTQLGLLVTLATLPFTCGFLNWAYPRIMEKIMPEMTEKKKEENETKLSSAKISDDDDDGEEDDD